MSVKALALGLPVDASHAITWREGSADLLSSRFARLRVRAAHRDDQRAERRSDGWLLIEWPEGQSEPAKYWLATVADDIPFERLVEIAKLHRRIRRDYQDLKEELGLGHYAGRGWRRFHYHATFCVAAYGFELSESETIPRQHRVPPGCSRRLPYLTVTAAEAPPIRPERQIPNSIDTNDADSRSRSAGACHDVLAMQGPIMKSKPRS